MQDTTPPPDNRRPLLERPLVRAAVAAVVLAVLAGAAVAVRAGGGSGAPSGGVGADASPASGTPAPAIGPLDGNKPVVKQPAPDFALQDTGGRVVRLSDLRGKVVWINFWASWCVPCKRELPDIQRLYDEKRDAGLEVLEVNYQEDADTATAFFRDRGVSMPLLLDSDGKVYDQYKLQGLPDSFFIDRDGNLAAVQYGYLTEANMRDRLAAAGLP